jgi:hypothetical protein
MMLRVLENVPDRDHIPQSMLQLALSLVNFAVGPPIPLLPCISYGDTCDFVWIRKDVCLRITTHLDNEDIFKDGFYWRLGPSYQYSTGQSGRRLWNRMLSLPLC